MTDPLAGRQPDPLAIPDGALATVRARSRGRRVRRLAGVTTASLGMVAALLMVGQVGPGDTVGVTGGPTIAATPSGPVPVDPVVSPSSVVSPVSTTPTTGTLGTPQQPTGSSAPRPAVSAATPPPRSAPPVSEGKPEISREQQAADVAPPCNEGTEIPDWCLGARVDSGSSGERSTFQLVVCRAAQTTDGGTLHYNSGQEVDFVVAQDGREVWRWSTGMAFIQSLHSVDVAARSCLVWSVEWDQRDEGGQLVAPGTYQLTATSVAEELSGKPTASASFPVGG